MAWGMIPGHSLGMESSRAWPEPCSHVFVPSSFHLTSAVSFYSLTFPRLLFQVLPVK